MSSSSLWSRWSVMWGRFVIGVLVLTLAVYGLPVIKAAAAPTGGNASISLDSTVDRVSVDPTLGVTMNADRLTGLPGQPVAYTASLSSTATTFVLEGSVTAVSQSAVTGTVASWFADVEVFDSKAKTWVVLGVASASKPGWTPVVTPPVGQSVLGVVATPKPSAGVTYPASGNRFVGTMIAPSSTASWSVAVALTLTDAQIAFLSDTSRAAGIRFVTHLEISPRSPSNGQPYISRISFTNPFVPDTETRRVPAAASNVLTGCAVTFTWGDGTTTTVDPTSLVALASVGPKSSVPVTVSWSIPEIAARAAGESDADYLSRLAAADGTSYAASVSATCGKGVGATGGTTQTSAGPVRVARILPIVTLAKSGPGAADAGMRADYTLTMTNKGSAVASVALNDVIGQVTIPVSGAPTSLVPGASGSATASYQVPFTQPSGNLTDTATVSWTDERGTAYGPVAAGFTTLVTARQLGTSLVLSPAQAGPNVPGTIQALTATLTNLAGDPVTGVPVTFTVTGPNPVTGHADAGGTPRTHSELGVWARESP